MDETPPTWAIVELMGHVKLAGRLSEEEKFGAKMGRVDVPQADGTYRTVYFGGSSVYRLQVVSEEVARHVGREAPQPVSPWDFPRPALTAAEGTSGLPYREDEDDTGDDSDF